MAVRRARRGRTAHTRRGGPRPGQHPAGRLGKDLSGRLAGARLASCLRWLWYSCAVNHGATEPPIPNSYWVETPYLLAGEYPGSHRADEAADRLAAFLNAGIENFIDLTEPGELEPYEPVLRELASARGVV